MGLDRSWFKFLPQPTPHSNLISISLVALPPKGSKQAATSDKPAGISEKKQTPVKKKEIPPSKEVVKHIPEKPLEPKRAAEPVIPPAKPAPQPAPVKPQKAIPEAEPEKITPPELKPAAKPVKSPVKPAPQPLPLKPETAIPKEVPKKVTPPEPKPAAKPVKPPVETAPRKSTTKKETPIKKELPAKKIKPKKSLKKITQKPKKEVPQKEVARVKSIEPAKPVTERDIPDKKSTPTPDESLPTSSEPVPQSQPQDAALNEVTSENAPGEGSATLATKGDTSAAAGLIMAKPLYRRNPPPQYPRRARRKGYEGIVILEVLVNENGKVEDLKVFKSSGYNILDKSALSAVQKWLFEAGTRNGKSTQMWVRVPIRFRLD